MLFLLVNRLRTSDRSSVAKARSFAAVATFTVAELRPYFATYYPTSRELPRFIFFLAWMTGLPIVITTAAQAPILVRILVPAGPAVLALVAIVVERRSARVLGPERIAFETPVRRLSWSVPLDLVQQCDLVPGQPTARLYVHCVGATYATAYCGAVGTSLRSARLTNGCGSGPRSISSQS